MFYPGEDDYPLGKTGQFAVCYMVKSEASFWFNTHENRASADKEFEAARHLEDILMIPVDGGAHLSAVIWIVQCRGGADWARVKETNGATAYLDEWG